jgi:hypothetical protein
MIDLYYWQQDAGGRALGKRRDSGRRKHKALMMVSHSAARLQTTCRMLRHVPDPRSSTGRKIDRCRFRP